MGSTDDTTFYINDVMNVHKQLREGMVNPKGYKIEKAYFDHLNLQTLQATQGVPGAKYLSLGDAIATKATTQPQDRGVPGALPIFDVLVAVGLSFVSNYLNKLLGGK